MFYYNKASRQKIIHTKDCHYIKYSNLFNIGWFETLDEAYEKGYRLCRDCNPILANFKNEFDKVSKNPRYRRFTIQHNDSSIRIFSAYGEWKLIIMPNGESIQLYHKNEFETKHDSKNFMCGFHRQNVHYNTLSEYLDYILDHDWYRTLHPVNHPSKPKNPPKQWTHQYNIAQKKAKKRARKQSIRNVLNLIDSLQTQPQPIM